MIELSDIIGYTSTFGYMFMSIFELYDTYNVPECISNTQKYAFCFETTIVAFDLAYSIMIESPPLLISASISLGCNTIIGIIYIKRSMTGYTILPQ
jgi:hypothetical protein